MSEHIENTATAVPPRRPGRVADRRRRGGAEEGRRDPVRAQRDDQQPMFGANGTAMIDSPASSPPPIMAGRRPTVSTNLPAGADGDGLGDRGAGERDRRSRSVGRCSTSTTSTGHQGGPDPERGPALGEVGQAGRLVPRIARAPSGTVRRLGGLAGRRCARVPRSSSSPDRAGDRQRRRRRRRRARSARSPTSSPPMAGPVIPPIRNPPWKKPGRAAAQLRRRPSAAAASWPTR